jgi:hypothetical protein
MGRGPAIWSASLSSSVIAISIQQPRHCDRCPYGVYVLFTLIKDILLHLEAREVCVNVGGQAVAAVPRNIEAPNKDLLSFFQTIR